MLLIGVEVTEKASEMIKKCKKLNKWMSSGLNNSEQNLEASSAFLLGSQNDPILNRAVACSKKLILYDNLL
ncbi:unnamed protein product [Angiostrongylus costaricensis]|uniref:Coatomer_WDAD domain-containing protein n=1 Tax=Angiostrongylus costaricensis TaxID=334426 RepID=A0A0R3PSS7_ANGCS|nr:unnamed protein product [Angiostrongylus costaricensis]